MLRSIYTDPIPTPAGRAGKHGLTFGLIGSFLLGLAIVLYAIYWFLRSQDDLAVATTFRVAAGWTAGISFLFYFVGIIFVGAGFTLKLNGPPDPGMKAVFVGFAVIAFPMIVVAMLAVYDKYGEKIIKMLE